jgi:hypothetical protein
VRFIGHVGTLLDDPEFSTPVDDLKYSEMATLTNRRSRMLDGELGAQILSGLLAGFGGSVTPDVSASIQKTKSLQFSFPAVRRVYVEIARIGALLAGRSFNKANLLTPLLVDPKSTVRLIDSVITAKGFDIEAGDDADANFSVKVPVLKDALAGAKVEVISKSAGHLSFQSAKRLTFAFTCVNVSVSADRKIRAIAPSLDKVAPPQLPGSNPDGGLDAHVLLSRTPGLIDFEEEQPV